MDRNLLLRQLKAMGEPTRLSLTIRLALREWGGIELLGAMKISQPSLSRHLRILREARLIRERREGRNSYYSLVDNDLAQAVVLLAQGIPLDRAATPPPPSKDKHIQINKSKVLLNHTVEGTDKGDEGEPQSPSIEEWLL